jgi:hypothetical protein
MCRYLTTCGEVREHRHGRVLVPTAIFPDDAQRDQMQAAVEATLTGPAHDRRQ